MPGVGGKDEEVVRKKKPPAGAGGLFWGEASETPRSYSQQLIWVEQSKPPVAEQ